VWCGPKILSGYGLGFEGARKWRKTWKVLFKKMYRERTSGPMLAKLEEPPAYGPALCRAGPQVSVVVRKHTKAKS